MPIDDRELENDPNWQAARLQFELSKRFNPAHSKREIEMARGAQILARRRGTAEPETHPMGEWVKEHRAELDENRKRAARLRGEDGETDNH